jgi:hypothetical protein
MEKNHVGRLECEVLEIMEDYEYLSDGKRKRIEIIFSEYPEIERRHVLKYVKLNPGYVPKDKFAYETVLSK